MDPFLKCPGCITNLASDDNLLDIFELLIGSSLDFCRPYKIEKSLATSPVTLSHVCRRWRNLLLSHSTFWSHIYTSSPEAIQAFIERSGMAKIDVHLNRGLPQALVHLVAAQSDRICQSHVFLHKSHLPIPDLMFKAPHLKSLTFLFPPVENWIAGDLWPRAMHCSLLSRQNLPNLTKLHRRTVSLPESAGFKRLTHLRLQDCQVELLLLLKAKPILKELILFQSSWNLEPPSSQNREAIRLPFLKWIHLNGDPTVLQFIQLSPKYTLRVDTEWDLVLQPMPIKKLYIKDFTFTAMNDTSRIQYATKVKHNICIWVDRPNNTTNLQQLWLYDCSTYPIDWTSAFQSMPSLTRLFFGPGLCMFALKMLTPGNGEQALCPGLQELHFYFTPVSLSKLLAFVQVR